MQGRKQIAKLTGSVLSEEVTGKWGGGGGAGVERAVPMGRRIKVLAVFHPIVARRHLGNPLKHYVQGGEGDFPCSEELDLERISS